MLNKQVLISILLEVFHQDANVSLNDGSIQSKKRNKTVNLKKIDCHFMLVCSAVEFGSPTYIQKWHSNFWSNENKILKKLVSRYYVLLIELNKFAENLICNLKIRTILHSNTLEISERWDCEKICLHNALSQFDKGQFRKLDLLSAHYLMNYNGKKNRHSQAL